MRGHFLRALIGFALFALVLLGVPPDAGSGVEASSGWTFEGCFTYFAAGPCLDVFRDPAGTPWICKACGTTKNPSPQKCHVLTGSGFWCS